MVYLELWSLRVFGIKFICLFLNVANIVSYVQTLVNNIFGLNSFIKVIVGLGICYPALKTETGIFNCCSIIIALEDTHYIWP